MPHPALRRTPARPRFDHGAPISAIDARPILLVVMLVTILVLLAASPQRMHALLVELPGPDFGSGVPSGYVVANRISITGEGQTMWNGWPVSTPELVSLLKELKGLEPQPDLIFEPVADAPYGAAANTLSLIWRANLVDERFCFWGLEKHQSFERPPLSMDSRRYEGEQADLQPLDVYGCDPPPLYAVP
jgi:biopolymer transport protein ExbD